MVIPLAVIWTAYIFAVITIHDYSKGEKELKETEKNLNILNANIKKAWQTKEIQIPDSTDSLNQKK